MLKPLPGSTINYGNPLTANLAACWLLNEGTFPAHDLVGGLLIPSNTGLTWGTNANGPILIADNSINTEPIGIAGTLSQTNFTLLAIESVTNNAEDSARSLENNSIGMSLSTSPTGKIGFVNEGVAWYPSTQTAVAGTSYDLAVTVASGNTANFYINGANAIANQSITIGASPINTYLAMWNQTLVSNISTAGAIVAWNRALSPTEIATLYTNPYAFINYYTPPSYKPSGNTTRNSRIRR